MTLHKVMPLGRLSFILWIVPAFILGCAASLPKGFLKLPENYLEKRQLQMKQFDTAEEEKIVSAVAGVLQDLGFTLDDSETQLGLVAASKKSDATDAGQVAGAVFMDFLSALGGTHSNYSANVDKAQQVKASVIVKPSLETGKMLVRATFQRIVWNASGQVSRVETIVDPEIYQKFYEALSKSIFLEAQSI